MGQKLPPKPYDNNENVSPRIMPPAFAPCGNRPGEKLAGEEGEVISDKTETFFTFVDVL